MSESFTVLTDTQDFTLPLKRKKKNQKFVEEKRPKIFVKKNYSELSESS